MDYNQLLYFRSVAHLGNISRAAEMHYTTHSSISKSIARLEAELGVPLFNHRKGQIELNEMGRMFLASVEESVGALQQGINNVYNHTARESVLSLSCTLGDSVNPVITEMTKRHPELLFKVVEYGYSRLEKEFSRSDIDFAIITRSFTRGGLISQKIAMADSYLILHRDHPLAQRTEVSIAELKEDYFLCDITSVDKEMFISSCRAVDFTPKIRYEVKGNNLVTDLLCSNACVAVLPPYMLLHHFRHSTDGLLRVVKLKENLPPLYIGMVYPEVNRGLLSSPVYSEFIELLTAQIKADIRAGEEYANGAQTE